MCAKDCGECVDCRETDTWPVPDDLRRPPAASVEAPESDGTTEPVHAPALTVHGFTEALRRDGGADPYTRGGRRGW